MPDAAAALESPWERVRLRVPRENGAVFARPSLAEAARDAVRNAERLATVDVSILGMPLPELRRRARSETLTAARGYTADVLGVPVGDAKPEESPLIVTGHQPAPFHVGVWIKNFGTRSVAEAVGGTALNVVIDGDLRTGQGVQIPAGAREEPRFESLPFDTPHPPAPWEEIAIGDRALFASFGERLAESLSAWGLDPVARASWAAIRPELSRFDRSCDALTAIRAATERRWGCGTCEVPMSRVCATRAFARFLLHVLVHAERFRAVHNTALREYRTVNRVRSRTHPVPDLESVEGRNESPFWIWSEGDGQRGRLFVRDTGRELELGDESRVWVTLPHPRFDVDAAIDAVTRAMEQGARLRTRALTTTAFLRLCLADQFLHGIGGAKYDELTDRVLARFFGVAAPAFALLTGTLHLPLGGGDDPAAARVTVRRLRSQLRDLRYNPDRYVVSEGDPDTAMLLAEKWELIAEQHRAEEWGHAPGAIRRSWRPRNRERYVRLRDVNAALASRAVAEREELLERLADARRRIQAESVLCSREWAWCAYPEESVRSFLRESTTISD